MSRTLAAALMAVGLVALGVAAALLRRGPWRTGPGPAVLTPEVDSDPSAGDLRERDCASGERPHAPAPLTPLDPAQQEQYQAAFDHLQVQYVDRPRKAIAAAEEQLRTVMSDRGYRIDPPAS